MSITISGKSLGKELIGVIDEEKGTITSLSYNGLERLLTPLSWSFPVIEHVPGEQIVIRKKGMTERFARATPNTLSANGFHVKSSSERYVILETHYKRTDAEGMKNPIDWPYPFSCELTYIINSNSLRTKIRILNKSQEAMPHSIGLVVGLRGNLTSITTFTDDEQAIDIQEPLQEPRIGDFGRAELNGIGAYVKADRSRRKGLPFAIQRISPVENGVNVLVGSHEKQPTDFTRLNENAGGRIYLRGPVEYEATVHFRH